MALKLVTPPGPVVTLAEAKRHVHAEDFTDDDAYLESLVEAATGWLDGKDAVLGRALGTQTWDYVLDSFPAKCGPLGGGIRIPLPPLQSVTSVSYVDPTTGSDVALTDGDDYEVDTYGEPGWVMPGAAGWPTPMQTINAVKVRFVAGYSSVPAPLKHAILLLVGDMYRVRGATSAEKPEKMPFGVEALITNYRMYS